MPKDEFQETWPEASRDPEPYQTLARRFKVSELVVARRALDLGYITNDKFIEFYNDFLATHRTSWQHL